MSETQSARSRRRARGRSAFRVDADHGALVPARRRAPDRRRSSACSPRVGGGEVFRAPHAPLPRPAVHDLGRRPDPEPRDEPEDGEPDHPLRGGAAHGRPRRAGSRSASCAATSPRPRSSARARARTSRRSSRSRSTRPRGHKAEKAANSLANIGHRRRLDLRRPEDRAPQQADRLEQGRARGHRPARSRTPSRSSRR